MGFGYRLAYRLGLTPWEKAGAGFGPQLDALLDRAEATRPGRGTALDVGCGTGEHSLRLARRGWDVLAIDNVPLALERARARAQAAGVAVRFELADVTELGATVPGDVRLVLDVGCFHGLPDVERAAYGRELGRVSAPGAAFLLFAFGPGRRGPLPRGASLADVTRCLPGWSVTAQEAADTSGMPGPLRSAAPQWYALERR